MVGILSHGSEILDLGNPQQSELKDGTLSLSLMDERLLCWDQQPSRSKDQSGLFRTCLWYKSESFFNILVWSLAVNRPNRLETRSEAWFLRDIRSQTGLLAQICVPIGKPSILERWIEHFTRNPCKNYASDFSSETSFNRFIDQLPRATHETLQSSRNRKQSNWRKPRLAENQEGGRALHCYAECFGCVCLPFPLYGRRLERWLRRLA